MDELALLKNFRLEDASPDSAREYARAALHAAMERRRVRRRYAFALAFVAAALLAAGAYAIVRAYVVGAPAPKEVNEQIAGRVSKLGVGQLIPDAKLPRGISGKTRIAAVAQTVAGPVYMLVTPLRGGGECRFIWIASERAPDGRPEAMNGGGGCEIGKPVRAREFGYGYQVLSTRDRHFFTLIEGYAPNAVRVQIGKRYFKTPFGWFIAELRPGYLLTAYDSRGHVVAQTTLRSPESRAPSPEPVVPIKPRRVVIATQTLYTHKPLRVSVAPSNKGTLCIYVYAREREPVDAGPGCGFRKTLEPNELQVLPDQLGIPSRQTLVLLGQVGSNIHRIEVRFSDDSTAPIPIREGLLLYQVRRENFRAGHRPVEVVGLDASGRIVARKPLPFAR